MKFHEDISKDYELRKMQKQKTFEKTEKGNKNGKYLLKTEATNLSENNSYAKFLMEYFYFMRTYLL